MLNDDEPKAQLDEPSHEPITEAYEPPKPDAGADEPSPEVEGEAVAGTDGSNPRLIVKRNGAETDTSFPIVSPATIGRFDPSVGPVDVDLGSLPEGVYVSRKHAKILNEDGVWKIQDLNSSNGTFVLRDDFDRVDEAELADGQEVALGNARFVFRLS